ncbi:MAG TPA: DUF4097 family beta strand repeat-containing protein [Opitutaceae bacterium]|nr:DUF4097 family beta strand repeat-containing protein [Opitutaceae bacterium]
MKTRRFFLITLAAAISAAGVRAMEAEVRRNFPVQPGCTLVVDSYRGKITIEETDELQIRVRLNVDVDAPTDTEAQRLRDELRLEFVPGENGVTITARNRRESGPRLTLNAGRLDLVYRISVPRQCNVDLKVNEGSVTVGSLAGRMAANVGRGGIFFRRIEGSIVAEADAGEIVVSRCSGAVHAKVREGRIRLGTIGGRADLDNRSGDIELMSARAGVVASAEAGDIAIGLSREATGSSRLTTSGGNIAVTLDPKTACTVQASSVWGRLQSDLAWAVDEGGIGKAKLAGRLNGGGPLLVLRANGGHVKINGGEVPFELE